MKSKFMGMKNPLDDFYPHKEMQHLAEKVFLGCPKTKGRIRRIKDSPGLGAESTGGLILPSSFSYMYSGSGCPSQLSVYS